MQLPSSLADLTEQLSELCRETGQFIRGELGRVTTEEVDEKGLNSLVSYVDRQAEERLVTGLRSLIPSSVFLTEEGTVSQSEGAYRWIIDPLDGTTNFLFGLPHFSVSVALEGEGELLIGVVYEAYHGECFSAYRGGGTRLDGKKVRVRNNDQLEHSLLATGFPYTIYDELPQYLHLFEHFMRNTRGLRRFGSAALDLAYVACGRYDAFFELHLNAWDIAAGLLLVREAGGITSDFRGVDTSLTSGEVIAASTALHPVMLRAVETHFV